MTIQTIREDDPYALNLSDDSEATEKYIASVELLVEEFAEKKSDTVILYYSKSNC